ncbi:MAG: hypothetical protein K8U03_09165 [Planctomycetia bacterium]|nr:hypothetical protein [Planctomycetia bacterium]
MSLTTPLQFTVQDALRHAREFCRLNPTWTPICDLTNEADYAPIPWKELPEWERRPWRGRYRGYAKAAWEEFKTNPLYRFRYGHVSGAGEFHFDSAKIPFGHNSMMVFEVGGRPGLYRRGGVEVKR